MRAFKSPREPLDTLPGLEPRVGCDNHMMKSCKIDREGYSADNLPSYKSNRQCSVRSERSRAESWMTVVLQVFGAIKTGTSSIVGLLNCHPRALVLYEIGLASDELSKHGGLLLQRHPQLRPLQRFITPNAKPYRELAEQLDSFGFDDRPSVIGDKYPGFRAINDYDGSADRVIFCVRDLRTWLAKDAVRRTFCSEQNVVPVATAYCRAFIKSFFWSNVMHVRLEEFVKKNSRVRRDTLKFLSLSPDDLPVNWWDQVGIYSDKSLKSSTRWWTGHPSSMLKPEKSDTTVTVRKNEFWTAINEIMTKYYDAASVGNDRSLVDRAAADTDIERLFEMNFRFGFSLQQCYAGITTETFGLKEKAQLAKRSAPPSTKLATTTATSEDATQVKRSKSQA